MGQAASHNNEDKVVGVVISDFTDGGLTALEWAQKYLKLPYKGYKMCIIHIKQVENQTDPSEVILGVDNKKLLCWDGIESLIKVENPNNQDLAEKLVDKFQELAANFEKISFRRFQGGHFQGTLQFAIDNDELAGLDMLILGCAAEDGRSPIMSQISLKLSGCSVVFARKDPGRKRKLTVNEEDCTQGSSNAGSTSGASSVNANAIEEGGQAPFDSAAPTQASQRRRTQTPKAGKECCLIVAALVPYCIRVLAGY